MLVALLLAAIPACALADGGAGDNQYQDPLAAPPPAKKVTKKAVAAPVTTPAPAPSSPPASAVAPATAAAPAPAPATSTTASSRQLPRTGFPAGWVALGGVALIAAGEVLRRRTATQ